MEIEDIEVSHIVKWVIYGVLGIMVLIFIFGSYYVVGSGERGVVVSAISGTEQHSYGEGIHFKTPIVDSVYILPVKTLKYEVLAESASNDLQTVHTTVAVNYHIQQDQVHKLYQTIGTDYETRVIAPSVQEVVKATTAKFTAEELITKRESVKQEIQDRLAERLAKSYITVEQISITNFDFSPEFNAQIEAKVTAQQRALTEENNLKVVQFQAQQKIAEAKGEAEKVRIINEQLTASPKYIDYITIQKWNGMLPTVTGSGGIFTSLQLPTNRT